MKIYFLIVLVMLITVTEGIATTSIDKSIQWPYSSILHGLQPSPNSVATGAHNGYVVDGIVIWAVGDTISVLNATDLSEIITFQVNTKKMINDIYYEPVTETLYLALGVSGLQIYDFSTLPLPPTLESTYAVSLADPGYKINSISNNSEATTAIDATGIGYHDYQIFMTDNYFGLRVIDVTDMTTPVETPLDSPVDIVLGTDYVYNPGTDQYEYQDRVLTRTSGYIQPNVNGSYDVTGGYNNVEVVTFNGKTYAFVHDYYYGLRVFDVTDPKTINKPVSRLLSTGDWFLYSALLNDIYGAVGSDYEDPSTDRLYAYVTALDNVGSSVVARFDVLSTEDKDGETIPLNWNKGRCITPGTASGVFVKGDHAYVADGTNGLQIVDVSAGDPVNENTPVLVYQVAGSYDVGEMNALSLVGGDNDNIYLHDALEGLHQIDISIAAHDNVSTSLIGTKVASPLSGDSVYVVDGFAYCLDSDDGFRIFDISELTMLSLEGFYQTTGNDISVLNNYAYIAKGSEGLEIVDVTTKASPVLAGSIDTADDAVAVAVYQSGAATYACVADSAGLSVIDVSIPASPGTPVVVAGTGVVDVSVSGDFAYIAENSGLTIVNLSAAPAYSVSGTKATTSNALAVSVLSDDSNIYALISDSTGIMIEDVTNPSAITTIGTIETIDGNSFVSLEVVENYLIAGAGAGGVYVYDISQPLVPIPFGHLDEIYPSKEVFPFKKDENFYFASAEESNVIAFYKLNFGLLPSPPLADSADKNICFISSLE